MTIAENITKKILSGEMRKEHGLDTGTGSMYHDLRIGGSSDLDAQYEVYKTRGLIKL